MAFEELTTDTLQDEVSNNETVIVQYAAGWCGNCRIMKPKFKKFAQEHENAKFIVIDAEKNPESRKLAKVDNLPTFAAFRNGELVQQTQTNKTEVLKSFIDETTSN
ncbi:thioredoxin family protein [Brumimicrobium aurantiacum]|uniref:Thioredoxin n=1 Tax=Brumimicrobium aurantiacum TaxID=1737063 RepID=A0A3E1EWE4_9FLAO|nr:thioredoxin family protein [Brumimicrobium aurantiacum]RFC53880.1 thioredoxin [Brumimicrobium aurantiacum]